MRSRFPILALLIYGSVVVQTNISSACSTPVFRYALQRWQPDDYEVMVPHREALTDTQERLLDSLRKATLDDDAPANMTVRTVDLSQPLEANDRKLLDVYDLSEESAWIMVRYPDFTETDRLAFIGPFDEETVRALVDSPQRREVVERITAGDSVVWVLIESGDQAKDNAAAQVLQQRLEHLEKTVELPSPVAGDIDDLFPSEEGSSSEASSATTLRLTWIRVGRDVPEEQVFVSMLINSESDLHEFSEPIAIPIFGRARSHFALVGAGINDGNIDRSCEYLCGACSCEVKVQNPGADLLVRANWDRLITDADNDEPWLPPLTGLGKIELAHQQSAVTDDPDLVETVPDHAGLLVDPVTATVTEGIVNTSSTNPIYLSMIVLVVLGFLVVIVGTLMIKSRQTSTD